MSTVSLSDITDLIRIYIQDMHPRMDVMGTDATNSTTVQVDMHPTDRSLNYIPGRMNGYS